MRKLRFIPLAFALLFAQCTNTEGDIDNEDIGGGESVKITSVNATISSTRTSALINSGQMNIYWSSSDKISITNVEKSAVFSLNSGAGTTKGVFTGSLELGSADKETLYALYPSSSMVAAGSGGLKATLPSSQSYVSVRGTDVKDRHLLFGVSSDMENFDFVPAAASVMFDITMPEQTTINSITMRADECNLTGTGIVDTATGAIGVTDNKTLTLTYANPPKGHSADGWAIIAPVDFKAASGEVYYDISTSDGVYTFCYKPEESYKAGELYTIALSVETFERVSTKEDLSSGKYFIGGGSVEPEPDPDPEPGVDPNLNVRAVRVTDSTISIGWTITEANVPYISNIVPEATADYTKDLTKKYKVALYKDAACQNLQVSVDNIDASALYSTMVPPRFVFTGLEPETTYYAKVFNTTDGTSNAEAIQITTKANIVNPASVVGSNAAVGDVILFENFAGLVYAGEMSSRAAGISRTDRNKLTSFDGADVKGEIVSSDTGYYMVGASTEIGLFNTLQGLLDEMGLDKWGWIGGKSGANGGSVCARPGYVKIGTTDNRSFICTPPLKAIPDGKLATLRVVFKAAPYGSPSAELANEAEKVMSVKALTSASIDSSFAMSYRGVVDEHLFTLDGTLISDWKEYTVILEGVPSGSSVALGGGLEATTTNRMLLDDVVITIDALKDAPAEPMAEGVVKYSDGTPAEGVVVSDGFTAVKTDAEGKYSIKPHQDTWYIYYSVPADCQVEVNQYGQPAFFTKYNESVTTYNFTLTKLSGGKENKFSLFCLADPQCKNATQRNRFNNESVPDIKAHAQTKSDPCYGVTLGDVAYSEGSRNCEAQMPYLRTHMSKSNIGMPIFQTMGNHDYTYFYTNNPISADETSSTYNIKAQRVFEECFGPIDYSWNRGDAHIVCMRNMQWNSTTSAGDYTMMFTDEQYNWLKQDLSFVPKDKLVIFCVHIPLTNSKNKNVQNVISLLKQYKEAHIMSGHTHYMRNEPTLSGGVYEHVHAAVCGTWWYSNVNGDGCPNGYGVYDIEGNTIKNWYYKGVNTGMNDRNYQIRLYRGNHKCGGSHEYIELQHGDNVILANVFNADNSWTVKVYEDDVYSGTMTMIPNKKVTPDAGTSQSNPTKPSTASSQDWWAIGYHVGVVGRGHVGGTRANYLTNGFHMYKYTLKNKNAKVRVEATDRFGTVYSTSTFTADYDYSVMK